MNQQSKIWIALGVAAMILALLLGLGILHFTPEEQTEPTYITLPPTPTLGNPSDPDWESPYDYNAVHTRVLQDVWLKNLDTTVLSIVSTSNPDTDFVSYVHVEDVVTVTIGNQYGQADLSKLQLIGVMHEDMIDPFENKIQAFAPIIQSPFTENSDGTWSAKFMIGYQPNTGKLLDLLFVYDNNIECYTMLHVQTAIRNSYAYWQSQYPDRIIESFTLNTGNQQHTYYYLPDEVHNMAEWVNSATNVDGWLVHENYLVNDTYEWYTPATAITNEHQYTLTSITSHNPFTQQAITLNPDSPAFYINKTANDVLQSLGEPMRKTALVDVDKYEYENIVFYIHPTHGVIQIDIKPNTYSVANILPHKPVTDTALQQLARQYNLHIEPVLDKSDTANKYYIKTRAFIADTYKIAYVWESENNCDITTNEFTRIVIYAGEEYIY